MNKPKVVIDTNVLLISLSRNSKFRPIFDALLSNQFTLCVSNEILSEYFEIIALKTNSVIATNVVELLLNLPNVEKVEIYFKWNLILADYDDNKFIDTAIAANANFIASNDSHFNILKEIDFPKIEIKTADEFLKIFSN
jgi:putative PIN family toxin of toxin-antitoxin system